MNTQEFAQKIKSKYPQYADMDNNDLVNKIITKYPQYKTQITDTPTQDKRELPQSIQRASDIGRKVSETQTSLLKGIGKGVARTLTGFSSLSERGIKKIGRTITPERFEKRLGFEKEEITSAERLVPERMREPEGVVEKIGYGAEQLAEFLIPSTKIAKIEKGRKLITRAGVEATVLGGITAAQKGEFGDEAKTATIIGAIFPVAGAGFTAIKKGLKPIGEKIQYTVIRPGLKDVKDGFKIQNVNKYNVGGSLAETATKTHIKLNQLAKELKKKLVGSNFRVNANEILRNTENRLFKDKTKTFGLNIGIKKALKDLKDELTEASLNLKGEAIDLFAATQLKRGAGTKGAWAYNRPEPNATAIEKVYTTFYQEIKKAIEKVAPKNVRGINKQLSELIPISNATLRRLPVEQRNNIISLTDSIGLFASVFDPRALTLIGAKKLSNSGRFGQFLINLASKTPTTAIGKRIFGQ